MIEVVVEGGDRNGPVAARPSLVVKGYKANWANTNAPLPKTQEIDPLIVLGRQGGGRDPAGRTTDMSGILVNVANTGSGFLSMTEMQSRIIDAKSAEPIKAIDIQEGVLDKVRKSYIGEVINAFNGRLGNAIQVQATGPGAEWQNVLVNIRPSDGVANLKIDANGNIHTLGYVQASLATPASSTSPCAPGQQEADNQYIYVCTSSNTWKRAALTNF